jgi:hypothetical protein
MGDFANAAVEIEHDIASLDKDVSELALRVAAIEARLTALETPPPPPAPEPPGIVVEPATAIVPVQDGATYLFREGWHFRLPIEGRVGVTLAAYPGETPVIPWIRLTRCADITIRGITITAEPDGVDGVFIDDRCERITLTDLDVSGFATGVRIEGRDVTCERVTSHDNTRMVNIGGGDAAGEHGAQAFCVAYTTGAVALIDCAGWNNIARDPRITYGGHDGAEIEVFQLGAGASLFVTNYTGRDGEVFIEAAGDCSGVVVEGGQIERMGLFSFHQANGLRASGFRYTGPGPAWVPIWVRREGAGVFGNGSTAGLSITDAAIETPGALWQVEGALDPTATIDRITYAGRGQFGLYNKQVAPTLADWQRLTGKDANSTWSRA